VRVLLIEQSESPRDENPNLACGERAVVGNILYISVQKGLTRAGDMGLKTGKGEEEKKDIYIHQS